MTDWLRRPRIALLLSALGLLTLAWSGTAQACGPGKRRDYVVAAGTSLLGVPWRITAGQGGQGPGGADPYIAIDFKTVGYPQSGFGAILPLPLRVPRSYFQAIGGSYTDPAPESDFAGFTGKRVFSLVVTFEAGDPVTISPHLPPSKLRRHICWMRRLKFFDGYFEGAPVPVAMTAFDLHGTPLGTKKAQGGSFF